MVEPNANEVFFQIYEPEPFYDRYEGSLYDWNQLYPRIVDGIREVDGVTPILVGGMGYSAVEWLPYLKPVADNRIVYVVHQYAPVRYTHQVRRLKFSYPGYFDTDWNGQKEQFDRAWLDDLLSILDDFREAHGVALGVAEFGVMRWEPGGAGFILDEMRLFEERGLNHALWVWDPFWGPWTGEEDAFNFRHGPERRNHRYIEDNELMETIRSNWQRKDSLRPSRFMQRIQD
jgi:hypothetical protein